MGDLTKFVDGYIQSYASVLDRKFQAPPPVSSHAPNPNGEVLALEPNTFNAVLKEGPVFIKFFAPWFVLVVYARVYEADGFNQVYPLPKTSPE